MKTMYEPQTFKGDAAEVVRQAERFCDDYARQGYRLTLRQLYYRFIATDAFPESRRDKESGTKNTERNYKWLGDLVSKARVGGEIDWNHIEDRTRSFSGGDSGWDSPESAIQSVTSWYGITHWDDQPEYVEVWVEKEALADVVGRPASALDVGHFACKGSPSTSSMYVAANRIRRQERNGRNATILYLGDHDPTGIDITRDVQDRLRLLRCGAHVERIALNMDQVLQYDPPPSPVKVTDSRTSGYIDEFGTTECWELDALEPAVLEELITSNIESRLDRSLYDARIEREERERATIQVISDNYDMLISHLRDEGLLDDEEHNDSDEDDDEDES